MAFPGQEYCTLNQAAKRWGVEIHEVQQAVVTGKLVVSVWLQPTYAYTITEMTPDTACCSSPHALEGYVPVAPESCRVIFSRGVVQRRKFPSRKQKAHYLIVEHLEKAELHRDDLVILNEDVERFEREYNLKPRKPCRVVSVHKLGATKNSKQQVLLSQQNDYRLVIITGYEFHFGQIQASIVKQLHEASMTENPWVYGKTLLLNAGSNSMVMRDAFRHQPHWKQLIHSNGKGHYRLSPT